MICRAENGPCCLYLCGPLQPWHTRNRAWQLHPNPVGYSYLFPLSTFCSGGVGHPVSVLLPRLAWRLIKGEVDSFHGSRCRSEIFRQSRPVDFLLALVRACSDFPTHLTPMHLCNQQMHFDEAEHDCPFHERRERRQHREPIDATYETLVLQPDIGHDL
jgi:hypothetical protein